MGSSVAVTGANGYLGSRLSDALQARGWEVYRLIRSGGTEGHDVRYTLEEGAPQGFFSGVDALVHCAYDFGLTSWRDIHRVNVEGSVRLLRQAADAGVKRIVFVSTISAYDGCKSMYGKAKLEIEAEARRLGAHIVRPGLVYGPVPGAMVRSLTKAVTGSSIVPLIGRGNQRQFMIHEDDLAELVALLIGDQAPAAGEPIIAANEHGRSFREILRMLAAEHGRRVRLVPVPWRLFWAAALTAELARIKLPFRSDSIVSLVHQDPAPDFTPTRRLGIDLRDYSPAR